MVKKILSILLLSLFILYPVSEENAQAAGDVTDCSQFGKVTGGTIEGTLARALIGGGDVTFQCSGKIFISPEIRIEINTKIDANEKDVVLSGANANSVFWVYDGIQLDLIGLKITEGNYTRGGGIRNMGGIVNLSNCELFGNNGYMGGGIANDNATNAGRMTMVNTTVSDNTAETGGGFFNWGYIALTDSIVTRNIAESSGGIYSTGGSQIPGAGTMVLTRSTVSYNTAKNNGGIINVGGTLTIQDSNVSFNTSTAVTGNGGGLNLQGDEGVLIFTNSILSNNSAYNGGGLYGIYGTIKFENSHIYDNYAEHAGAGIFIAIDSKLTVNNCTFSNNISDVRGGAFYQLIGPNNTGSAQISNSTISGNTAGSEGGGIYNYAPLTLTNVTFFGNRSLSGNSIHVMAETQIINSIISDNDVTRTNCAGFTTTKITDGGYNISDDGSCNLTAATSLINTDPMLAYLSNNGGYTDTHALLPGSPAIDKIPLGTNGCGVTIEIDQRGVTRPQGDGCDIGAFELEELAIDDQPPAVSDVLAAPNPSSPNTNITLTALVDDTSSGNSNVVSADFNINNGNWISMSAADEAFDSPQEAVTGTIVISNSGSHTVCVRGTDSSGNISDPQCTNLSIVESPTNIIYVGDLEGTIKFGKRTSTLTAKVKVLDENGSPVSNVNVKVQITNPPDNGVVSELTAKTNRSGIATFKTSSAIASWNVCVISLTKNSYIYYPDANTETCETYTLP